jgi:hypothetical protein
MGLIFITLKRIDMKTILLSQKGDPGDKKTTSEKNQEDTNPYEHEMNIADGGEFLDDGLRMKDQPFGKTEEKEDDDNLS